MMRSIQETYEVHRAMLRLLKKFGVTDIQGDGLRATGTLYYKKLKLDCCVTYFTDMGILELRISRQVSENTKFVVAKETRDYFRITDIQASNKLIFEKEFWIKELSLKSMLPFIASWFKTMLQNIISVKLINQPPVNC